MSCLSHKLCGIETLCMSSAASRPPLSPLSAASSCASIHILAIGCDRWVFGWKPRYSCSWREYDYILPASVLAHQVARPCRAGFQRLQIFSAMIAGRDTYWRCCRLTAGEPLARDRSGTAQQPRPSNPCTGCCKPLLVDTASTTSPVCAAAGAVQDTCWDIHVREPTSGPAAVEVQGSLPRCSLEGRTQLNLGMIIRYVAKCR